MGMTLGSAGAGAADRVGSAALDSLGNPAIRPTAAASNTMRGNQRRSIGIRIVAV